MEKEKEKEVNLLAENIMILWNKKLIIILSTFLISLVLVTFLFFYHKNGKKIETKIELSFLNVKEKKYPDISPFSYQDVISNEILEKAKNSNKELFENIDIEKIKKNEAIRIEAEIDTFKYNISFDVKYANGDIPVAKEFLSSIKKEYLTFVKEKNEKTIFKQFDFIFNNYKNMAYHDFFEEIYLFYDSLDFSFQKLLESDFFLTSINDIRNNYNSFLSLKKANNLVVLINEYLHNKFISKKDDDLFKSISQSLEKERNHADDLLVELKKTYNELSGANSGLSDSSLLTQITNLTIEVKKLSNQIDYFGGTDHTINKNYNEKIDKLVTSLKSYEEQFDNFYLDLLNKHTNLYSHDISGFDYSISSPFNLIFFSMAVLFLTGFMVISFVLFCNWFISYNNETKKALK